MSIRHVESPDMLKEIVNQYPYVLVDFFATWCGPCKMLHPVLEEVSRKLEDKVRVAQVDIDELQDLAGAFHIQSVPTLIFFKDGKAVLSKSGYMDEESLMSFIEMGESK